MAYTCMMTHPSSASTCPWKSLLNSTSITTMESNFKLLVEKGVDLHIRDDRYGFTHLFNVAQMGQGSCFGRRYTNPLLDFLLDRPEFSREDKIDALEMAGSCILLAKHCQENFPLAYQYWRRALSLRLMDTEECRPIHKTPTNSKNGQLSEWSTLDDINNLEQNPSQRVMQSLLVQLRIFSSISWNALRFHFSIHLWWEGSCLLSPLLDLVWTYLDLLLHSSRPHEKNTECMLSSLAFSLIDRTIFTYERLSQGNPPQQNSENLLKLVDILLMSDPSYLYDCNLSLKAVIYTTARRQVFTILSRSREMITKEIKLSLTQRMPSGLRLLHIACYRTGQETFSDLRFLVSLGADPNVGDSNGNRVLHMLAVQPQSEIRDSTARLFKKLGAHLCPDMVNKEGRTPAQLWMERNNTQEIEDLPDWLRYDEDDVVSKLKCQAARVIHRYGVPHNEIIIPATLVSYITWH